MITLVCPSLLSSMYLIVRLIRLSPGLASSFGLADKNAPTGHMTYCNANGGCHLSISQKQSPPMKKLDISMQYWVSRIANTLHTFWIFFEEAIPPQLFQVLQLGIFVYILSLQRQCRGSSISPSVVHDIGAS